MEGEPEQNHLLLEIMEPGGARSVVIEDDGRVAWAYLREGGTVVGDVWLYNVAPAPDQVERSDLPPMNPRRFCREGAVLRIAADWVLRCVWSGAGVDLFADGVLMARLARGAKPGWSRAAAKASPVAKPLEPG